jgi:hypothetical protein
VLLVLQSLNGGAQLDSDVRNGEFSTFICEDEVDVTVAVQPKNPTLVSAPSASVKLDSYEVRYTRTDGRGTEGVDVPYRVTGTLTQVIEMNGAATIPIEVVRRQAKLDPPLNNINQTTVLTVNAQVILFGKTIADQRVSTSGWMQIDFADFGDEDTACPSN